MNVSRKTPHPIDVHVGSRIRIRRKSLGFSQTELAAALGLTFQQVQKYETGFNRISASKLYSVAVTLKARVSYFFDGYDDNLPHDDASAIETTMNRFFHTTEGLELAQAFPKVGSVKLRRRVLDLVKTLAEPTEASQV